MPERRMQDARWVQDSSIASDEKWWGIECEINWSLGESTLVADTGMAIVFLGLSAANGKHRCRPATKEEMMAPETDESSTFATLELHTSKCQPSIGG